MGRSWRGGSIANESATAMVNVRERTDRVCHRPVRVLCREGVSVTRQQNKVEAVPTPVCQVPRRADLA